MLAVSVELLHGTFRGDPDGAANTGRLIRGEWPPSPARLFAALVAADGTGERCRVTDGTELEWLERLPPPDIHAHTEPWHQVLQPRYVVQHRGTASKSTHQEYVGRTGALIRPGVRVTPRHPRVVYLWNPSPPERTLSGDVPPASATSGPPTLPCVSASRRSFTNQPDLKMPSSPTRTET